MDDRVGQQLGNYRLIRLLGHGGFAEVYLGEHLRLNTHAAIKVLYTRLAGKDEVESFQQEARIIAHLEHPHIVRVFDFDVVDDTPFLVMSYAPGGTLRQRHPKGTILPLPTIIAYVQQVADALQYAHDRRLVHRDIKPENMLVGQRNQLLLSDFGIAIIAQSSRYQGAQNMAGTVAYMAPEQVQGKPRLASDQYALAICVYEWLCGEHPFHGSFTEIATQQVLTPPPSLCGKIPTLSRDVEQVVMTALAKEPRHRFPSVQEFVDVLRRAAQTPPLSHPVFPAQKPLISHPPAHPFVHATPEPHQGETLPARIASQADVPTAPLDTSRAIIPSQQPPVPLSLPGISRTNTRLSRRAILLMGAAVGGAISLGGVVWFMSSRTSSSPQTTPIILSTPLFIYTGHTASVTSVAWSPDGNYIASTSIDGKIQVWDARSGKRLHTYADSPLEAPVWAVAWSPDSKHIVSGSWDKTARVWDAINGGEPLLTYKGHTGQVSAVKWLSDDTRIVSGSADWTVQVWSALREGSALSIYTGYTAPVTGVDWSPDGTRIVGGSRDKTVRVWEAIRGGRAFVIYKGHTGAVNAVDWSLDGPRIASSSVDKTVQVWNATNGNGLLTYKGHTSVVNTVAWSPDSKYIVSGSYDQTAHVWDATTGSTLVICKGHSAHVDAVAWSPDGTHIVTGSVDETLRVWKVL